MSSFIVFRFSLIIRFHTCMMNVHLYIFVEFLLLHTLFLSPPLNPPPPPFFLIINLSLPRNSFLHISIHPCLHTFIHSLISLPLLPPFPFSPRLFFPPQATVLDACLDKGRGIIADVLVQWGELKVGDAVVIGTSFGRVKSMEDHLVKLNGR